MTPREKENVKNNCKLIVQDKVNQLNKAIAAALDNGVVIQPGVTISHRNMIIIHCS